MGDYGSAPPLPHRCLSRQKSQVFREGRRSQTCIPQLPCSAHRTQQLGAGWISVGLLHLPFFMVFAKSGLEHTHDTALQLRPFPLHSSWALNHHREHFMPSWTWAELASAQSSALRMTSSSETLWPRAQDPPDCCLSPSFCYPSRLSVPAGFLLATILGTVCLVIASVIYLLVSGCPL